MLFSDLALSRRLERAEGYACLQYAVARKRVFPSSSPAWMECGGANVVFDGIESPITQTFGLGIFEPLTTEILDTIEKFFIERGAPVFHEISPFVGVAVLDRIASRYKPVEISSVMCRPVEAPPPIEDPSITVHAVGPHEAEQWGRVSAQAWAHEHPELMEFLLESSAISTAREGSVCFFAEIDGVPAASGALSIHEGVALFAGAATIPEYRRRGLQAALLNERLRYAHQHRCDLAMMVAEAGSNSQRNAERQQFRIAYTRTKWQLR